MTFRRAHSLIEILVVLIIVGVLMAIAVPVVQKWRGSARRTQCTHHQRELIEAVHLYVAADSQQSFPGYRSYADVGETTVVTWPLAILRQLGRKDLVNSVAAGGEAKYVEMLVCPSDEGPRSGARLSYVANGGQAGIDDRADGVFYDHTKPAAERLYITIGDFGDSLGRTIILAENLDATVWTTTEEESLCILWPLTAGNEVNQGSGSRPSSHHPGGFVAAFGDSSVKFMAESDINLDANVHTDQSKYVALLTPGGDNAGDGIGGPTPGPDDPPEGECYIDGFGFPEVEGYQVQMSGGDFPNIPQPIDFGQELFGYSGQPFLLVPINCNQYEIWFSDHVAHDGHLATPNYDEEIHLTRQSDGQIKMCVKWHSFTIYNITIVDPDGVPVPGLIDVPPNNNRCATSLIPGNVSALCTCPN